MFQSCGNESQCVQEAWRSFSRYILTSGIIRWKHRDLGNVKEADKFARYANTVLDVSLNCGGLENLG